MENLKLDPARERKPYEPPAVTYEAPLEVRAGTPFIKSLFDPLVVDPTKK